MKTLLLVTAFNPKTQTVYSRLEDREDVLSVYFFINATQMINSLNSSICDASEEENDA
jgi:hypothetical protein